MTQPLRRRWTGARAVSLVHHVVHSCGLHNAREFRREHVRIVQISGQSIAFNMLYPYPSLRSAVKPAFHDASAKATKSSGGVARVVV